MTNEDARNFIKVISKGYKERKRKHELYSSDDSIPERIIEVYLSSVVKPQFKNIVDSYKKKYIYNESRVENNTTRAEKMGLGEVYDYISKFDFSKDKFNIFVQSLLIHQKLYSKCPNPSFGGSLRDGQAILKDTPYEVMEAEEAKRYFNTFIASSDFIFEAFNEEDYFRYINECIILSVKLIQAQPFSDGNKRTFRALLNLLFKRINIPPIYIDIDEREEYKKALFEAIEHKKYDTIIRFYYYKICDAIVELDVNNSELNDNINIKYLAKK